MDATKAGDPITVARPGSQVLRKGQTMSSPTSAVTGRRFMLGVLAAVPALFGTLAAHAQTAPLPSWNDRPAKQGVPNFGKLKPGPGAMGWLVSAAIGAGRLAGMPGLTGDPGYID